MPEAVDIFIWGDEVAEFVGLILIGNRQLEDDAMNGGVGIGREDFACYIISIFGAVIFDYYANIFAVGDFEIDVFGDDWVVAIADDEKLGSNL